MYSIKLTANHKEHTPTFIGITDKPAEFIAKWLEDRSQFTGQYTNEEKTRWTGHNSYNKWENLDLKYRTEVKWSLVDGKVVYEKDEKGNYVPDTSFDHKITITELKGSIPLHVPLEEDAKYYL